MAAETPFVNLDFAEHELRTRQLAREFCEGLLDGPIKTSITTQSWETLAKELTHRSPKANQDLLEGLLKRFETPNAQAVAEFLTSILTMAYPTATKDSKRESAMEVMLCYGSLGDVAPNIRTISKWEDVTACYSRGDIYGNIIFKDKVPTLPTFKSDHRTLQTGLVAQIARAFSNGIIKKQTGSFDISKNHARFGKHQANVRIPELLAAAAESIAIGENPNQHALKHLANIVLKFGGWPLGVVEAKAWHGLSRRDEFIIFISEQPYSETVYPGAHPHG